MYVLFDIVANCQTCMTCLRETCSYIYMCMCGLSLSAMSYTRVCMSLWDLSYICLFVCLSEPQSRHVWSGHANYDSEAQSRHVWSGHANYDSEAQRDIRTDHTCLRVIVGMTSESESCHTYEWTSESESYVSLSLRVIVGMTICLSDLRVIVRMTTHASES